MISKFATINTYYIGQSQQKFTIVHFLQEIQI